MTMTNAVSTVAPGPQFRLAEPADAEAIAKLHADSWRRHYRGAYSDAFLDGDVVADRLAVWTDRVGEHDPRGCTILAENGGLLGFAHALFDEHPRWGALLDNVHVADGQKRRGIGSRLLALTAEAVAGRRETGGLYLWVLEQNVDAQAFYESRGGSREGRELVSAPGGDRQPPCGVASEAEIRLAASGRSARAGASDSEWRVMYVEARDKGERYACAIQLPALQLPCP
jgi:GNAT superfamily N-acetyltransferase